MSDGSDVASLWRSKSIAYCLLPLIVVSFLSLRSLLDLNQGESYVPKIGLRIFFCQEDLPLILQ